MATSNLYADIEYSTIETWRNFENGISQTQFRFPSGTYWAYDERGKEYWTIVSKEFFDNTKWSGPFGHAYIFDKWVAIYMRDIDHHKYFDYFSRSSKEMIDQLHLENRIFVFIKDSSICGGLVRFGEMDGLVGQATYIQLLSHGIQNDPLYGIYTDPKTNITQPDVFGTGKWLEVSQSKAYRVWCDMYGWVLDKLVFKDTPCPLMLNCNDAYEVWKCATLSSLHSTYDAKIIEEMDKSLMKAMIAQIANFAAQFFTDETITKIQKDARTVDYDIDYIDEDERKAF